MATTALVDISDIEVGRRIIAALMTRGIPVNVAFWAHIPEISEWQLFIATPLVDSKGPKSAYKQVLRILHDAGMDPELPWRRIFLRSPKDPVLRSLEHRTSYSGPIEIVRFGNSGGTPSTYYVTYARYPGTFRILNEPVGDSFIEDAYVYGIILTATGLDQLRALLSMHHVGRDDQESAIKELSASGRAVIPHVRLSVRDFKRLRPA